MGRKTSKVRNQRRKIRGKRESQRNLPSDPNHGGIGSASEDKRDLVPGAIPARTENALIAKMVGYDRVVWPVTDLIKEKTVSTLDRNLDDPDGKVSNGAAANIIRMEQQNIEANKALPPPPPPPAPTQVQINVNTEGRSVEEAIKARRTHLLLELLESEQDSGIRPVNGARPPGTIDVGLDQGATKDGDAESGDDPRPMAETPLEFPGPGTVQAPG